MVSWLLNGDTASHFNIETGNYYSMSTIIMTLIKQEKLVFIFYTFGSIYVFLQNSGYRNFRTISRAGYKPHYPKITQIRFRCRQISRTIQAAHKEDRWAGRTRVTGCTSPQRGHCVAFKSKCLTETQWKSIPYWNTFRFGPCWRPALAGSAIAPRVPMPHDDASDPACLHAIALRPDCHVGAHASASAMHM